MITVIALFQLPADTTLAAAKQIFESTAPRYRDAAGLVRKYYLFDPATRKAGGCYLLADRRAAEQMFDDKWHAFVSQKYGVAPQVTMFESPVIVDNVLGQIQIDD